MTVITRGEIRFWSFQKNEICFFFFTIKKQTSQFSIQKIRFVKKMQHLISLFFLFSFFMHCIAFCILPYRQRHVSAYVSQTFRHLLLNVWFYHLFAILILFTSVNFWIFELRQSSPLISVSPPQPPGQAPSLNMSFTHFITCFSNFLIIFQTFLYLFKIFRYFFQTFYFTMPWL